MLELNFDEIKSIVGAKKILQTHHHLDMEPRVDWELELLPHVLSALQGLALITSCRQFSSLLGQCPWR